MWAKREGLTMSSLSRVRAALQGSHTHTLSVHPPLRSNQPPNHIQRMPVAAVVQGVCLP
jgi:hypothetical protein